MTRGNQTSPRPPEPPPAPQRVTISDIARAAGVAPSTVSYALNNRPGVGEVVRTRILDIAADLGWRPNSSARALRAAQSRTVGMVLQQRSSAFREEQSSFLLNLITGIDRGLSLDGFSMLLSTVPDIDSEVAVYGRWWVEQRVDGVVVYNPHVDDPRLRELERLGLPGVVMGRVEHPGPLASVWSDNFRGSALAVDHLVATGHRRIARIGTLSSRLYAVERRQGFERAMAEARLRSDLSIEAPDDAGGATLALLDRADPPTAIIFEADTLAIQGMLALRARGVSIPDQLSIVAWDDCTTYQLFSPPLSALHRDIQALGQTIAHTLLDVLQGKGPKAVQGATTGLVVRGSTGPPAAV